MAVVEDKGEQTMNIAAGNTLDGVRCYLVQTTRSQVYTIQYITDNTIQFADNRTILTLGEIRARSAAEACEAFFEFLLHKKGKCTHEIRI